MITFRFIIIVLVLIDSVMDNIRKILKYERVIPNRVVGFATSNGSGHGLTAIV